MSRLLSTLDTLKRPRLLINAARIGIADYRREPHLARHLGDGLLPSSAQALARLLEIEEQMDAARRARLADYSVARHVDILIAIMAEARILRASAANDPSLVRPVESAPQPVA